MTISSTNFYDGIYSGAIQKKQAFIAGMKACFENNVVTREKIVKTCELFDFSASTTSITKWLIPFKVSFGKYYFGEAGQMTSPQQHTKHSNHVIDIWDKNKTFGVELEFGSKISGSEVCKLLNSAGVDCAGNGSRYSNHGQNIDYSKWNVTYDCTIIVPNYSTKLEIVSPILKGKEGATQLRLVMSILQGLEKDKKIRINHTCGTHVHIGSGQGAGYDQLSAFNFYRMYAMNEAIFDSLQPNSRRGRGTKYCGTLKTQIGTLSGNFARIDRYKKVNLNHVSTRGVVEVRHHSGTVDFDKISSWIHLMFKCLDRSCLYMEETKKYKSLEKMTKDIGLDKNVTTYLKSRVSALSADDQSECYVDVRCLAV